MMSLYKKPVHEICVDKTSCRHEVARTANTEIGSYGSKPTEQLTKDSIRKAYVQANDAETEID
jgi:hypothetical protein